MKVEKFYKAAFIQSCDLSGKMEILQYSGTDEAGARVDKVYEVQNRPNRLQQALKMLLRIQDESPAENQSGKRIAFSLASPPPHFKHFEDKNLSYAVVVKTRPQQFYAMAKHFITPVRINGLKENEVPENGADVMEVKPGQQILFDALVDECPEFSGVVAYRIETMYNTQFPDESLPLKHHIGFVPAPFEDPKKLQVLSEDAINDTIIVSFSENSSRPTNENNRFERQNWMEAGMFCYYECERNADGKSEMKDFKCLGMLYKRAILELPSIVPNTTNEKMMFKDVPCVYRKFEENKKQQTMWNDYLGLVECQRSDFRKFGEELKELDIIYLDVFDSFTQLKGVNPRKVDKLVENSLREHCSHSLQTDDFKPERDAKEAKGFTLDGKEVKFNHFEKQKTLSKLKSLRITYYPNGNVFERFITTLILSRNEIQHDHPMIPMSGRFRNPNVEHEVEPTEEKHEKEPLSFGYISKFSHKETEPFEITFLDGTTKEFGIEKRDDFMNYGVFVKVTKKEIKNRGYLFPITSRRDERSIAVPAFAYVKPIGGNKEKYGCETVFGNIRIRHNGTADGIKEYNHIEHNSKILLKNLKFENKEWVAEYDNIY